MRLLVVSHPCVTPVNQDFFAAVAEDTGWDLTIVTPNRWRNEYGSQRPARSERFVGRLVAKRVGLPGHIPLHFYASGLNSLVRMVRPDAAYLHHEPYAAASFQWARAFAATPFAVYSAQNIVKRFPPPFAQAERYVLRRAAAAFPVSGAVADVLRIKGFSNQIDVQPLAVDTSRFTPATTPPEAPMVGYVGRLSTEKGVDVLLRAVASSAVPAARCLIAGAGPAEPALRALAAELGIADRVEWLGYVAHTEVEDFYRRLRVLAVPSLTVPGWTEQFGRVVIEAIASGVPVISSDSGELPNLLSRTGGGRSVPEGDPSRLAAALDEALSAPGLLEEARAAAPVVAKQFGERASAQRFARALNAIRRTA